MDFDVVIVGGGLAGLSLAAALRNTPLRIALIEGRPPRRPEGWDARVYAVSPANVRFLEAIGVWEHVRPARLCQVEAMEVYGDGQGRLDLSAYDAGVPELAWIVESAELVGELWETVRRQGNLTLLCPAKPQALNFDTAAAALTLEDGRQIGAKLVVAADGADSWTRTAAGIIASFKSYHQRGVVANFHCEAPHHNQAFQWFRSDGVLAYLPLPENGMSMVWSTPEEHARSLLEMAPDLLCVAVAQAGGHRLGRLKPITPPAAFPLRLMRAPQTVRPRLALIGDAAHTIHPLSGHGINLGFQDAQVLSVLLAARPGHVDCGDLAFLRGYERSRKEEVVVLQGMTDALHRLFAPAWRPLSHLRNFGLNITNHLPVVKNQLIRYALES
ncbi:MAG: UbiH/UbiF family hydroxylase [Proteobacteria bacterium]|nr:UbiH/UbiF family hydroxylase [Pseudomonadota bacterium]HQR04085.1 UbiH/UbiF family hydroxylase [Rhodocyclaceae bacterium]